MLKKPRTFTSVFYYLRIKKYISPEKYNEILHIQMSKLVKNKNVNESHIKNIKMFTATEGPCLQPCFKNKSTLN